VRFRRAAVAVVAGVGLLLVGVGRLQLVEHERLGDLAERNWIRLDILRAPRGRIFDRTGRLLADNRPAYHLVFVPPPLGSPLPDTLPAEVTRRLSRRFGVPDSVQRAATREAVAHGLPVPLAEDLPLEAVAVFEEERALYPGVEVRLEPRRAYPEGTLASHLLGYAGEITSSELAHPERVSYRPGDLIGRAGLERSYETTLRGRDGSEAVVVNASGRRVRAFDREKPDYPVPGRDLLLTLDLPTQRALEEAMARVDAGAAVAIDPRDGGVLALVSRPSFDPNEFAAGLSAERWAEIASDRSYPLLNRAVQSAYPPGSTFKVVVSLAALTDQAVALDELVSTCTGGLQHGRRYFRCWLASGHGSLSLVPALAHSCDVYFYLTGLRMGLESLGGWARRAGFGGLTGIDLPSERSGLFPTPAWFDERYGAGRWNNSVVLNLSIGQGEVLATPIQLARLAAVVGTHGLLPEPHVVRAVRDPATGQESSPARHRGERLRLPEASWAAVERAMEEVVRAGTGGRARIEGVRVAGKTGTSQNPHGEDHALFIAVAPVGEPRIAIAVVAENSGHGGSVAAPIAARALSTFFRLPPRAALVAAAARDTLAIVGD
jgi:penicillin-binding protein 2